MQPEYLSVSGAAKLCRDTGFPISDTYFERLCHPSRNEGPKPVGVWGRNKMYRPGDVLAWAENRLKAYGAQAA